MKDTNFLVNANGFIVLNAEDGYRKDNTLWFGECSECGERVTNSRRNNIWEHTVYTYKKYYSQENFERGMANQTSSYQVDFCPTKENKIVECEIEVLKELA